MTTHDRVRLQLQALEALLREHQDDDTSAGHTRMVFQGKASG